MDHDTAVQLKASERYVIGDLSSGEREDFEEHFADCTRCMDDLSTASAFVANAKAVFRERALAKPAPRRAAWQAWLSLRPFPLFAALSLAAVALYQNMVVIPGMKAPRSQVALLRLDGATRSAIPQAPAGDALRAQMAFDQPAGTVRVFVELMDTLGNIVSHGAVPAPKANQPLDLYFPVKLNPGRYTVLMRADEAGRPGRELARNSFEVTSQEMKTQ